MIQTLVLHITIHQAPIPPPVIPNVYIRVVNMCNIKMTPRGQTICLAKVATMETYPEESSLCFWRDMFNYFNERLQCCEDHKQNCIHLHRLVASAVILGDEETDISVPGQK